MKPGVFFYCLLGMAALLSETSAQNLNLLIGTYTKPGKSEGIYVYTFDASTGKLRYKNKVAGLKNPSYLAISTDEKFVYAVNESGPGEGAVSALAFDKVSGELKLLNQESSGGDGPCYVSINKENTHVFVANYSGGSFTALPVLKDGRLSKALQTEKFNPNGRGKGQQASPHAHSAVLSPDEKYLYVSDLGNDEILSYAYSGEDKKPLNKLETVKLPHGSGPRHFQFHPNGKFAYSVQELSGEVVAFTSNLGKLTLLQSISGLPAGYTGRRWAADIHISPDGKFLYSSNRDDLNDIAIFSIQANGKLIAAGRQSTLGKAPRNFVIDPSGKFLLVANQDSNSIVVFKRDTETGLLEQTGDTIEIDSPVCLKFSSQ